MGALDAIALPQLAPSDLLGLQLCLLDRMATSGARPTLIVYQLDGNLISIGRYHLYGGPLTRGAIRAYRRLSGGRIVSAGHGWLGISLVLPSWTFLLPPRDASLKPEQAINRYVRGLLAGLRRLGLDCFYPGRDRITVNRREIANCSFEGNPGAAMLFEASVAVSREANELARDLDEFDPHGALTWTIAAPAGATCIAHELGRDVTFGQLCEAIFEGYGETLGELTRRELDATEAMEARRRAAQLESSQWLNDRSPDPTLDRVSRAPSQLGFIEARLSLRDGVIERLMIAGDFIANARGVAQFESLMRGAEFALPAVTRAALETFASGENFILGIGDLNNLVQLIMKAQ